MGKSKNTAFKYLMPYITDISVNILTSHRPTIHPQMVEDITGNIQDIWCDILNFTYGKEFIDGSKIDKFSIVIENGIYETLEMIMDHPNYNHFDKFIFFDIYREIYQFCKSWGITYEHFEFVENLRNMQLSVKDRILINYNKKFYPTK